MRKSGVSEPALREWKGLRNLLRPELQPFGALAGADNVVLDDAGTLERRPGYLRELALTGITDSYGHASHTYALLVAAGILWAVRADGSRAALASNLTETAFSWAQSENRMVYAGALEAGMVLRGSVWLPLRFPLLPAAELTAVPGRLAPGVYRVLAAAVDSAGRLGPVSAEAALTLGTGQALRVAVNPPARFGAEVYVTGADDTEFRLLASLPGPGAVLLNEPPQALGPTLLDDARVSQPLPAGVLALTVHDQCLVGATAAGTGTSLVFWSKPWGFQWFELARDSFAISGRVLGLQGTPAGLLIGTERALWLRDGNESLVRLADYGVVPGRPFLPHEDGPQAGCAIWTQRGLGWFGDGYQLLFERKLSVAPGRSAHLSFFNWRGSRYVLARTDGAGAPFNAYAGDDS